MLCRYRERVNSGVKRSLQLGVLSFGLLQDGGVGDGIFPEGEEALVGGFRFGGIACHRVGAAELKMRQLSGHKVGHNAPSFIEEPSKPS
jgi:hypothetical protein